MHAAQCPAVRLICTKPGDVTRCVSQGSELNGGSHQASRHRQLAAKPVQCCQVVAECHVSVATDREPHHLRGDKRVAVSVAADPRAHADRGGTVCADGSEIVCGDLFKVP